MARKPHNHNHNTQNNDTGRSSSTPRMLPPEPRQLLAPPGLDRLAQDGSYSRPMNDGDGLRGWMVFDASGRMEEVFGYAERELTVQDLLLLDHFEAARARLADPAFADYTPGARKRQANAAPAGEPEVLHLHYFYGGAAADLTFSVFVFSQGTPDAWLVLDADGRLVDGAHFPYGANAAEEVELFAELLLRRQAVGDPRVGIGVLAEDFARMSAIELLDDDTAGEE